MPADDPTPELEEILKLCDQHKLPAAAREFAAGALDTAEDILETISDMESSGADAPTPSQEEALEHLQRGLSMAQRDQARLEENTSQASKQNEDHDIHDPNR